jgi:Fe-S-cluster containining protein
MEHNKLYNALHLRQLSKNANANSKKLISKIKAKKPRNLDTLFYEKHTEAFTKIDCLSCANCCKSLGPRITDKDIEKLSKYLRLKSTEFIASYLKIDEDNDFVFKQMPCAFLAPDNYCMVYEHRPKACRQYPHTNSPKMIRHLNLALKNAETCPAVYLVLEDLKRATF